MQENRVYELPRTDELTLDLACETLYRFLAAVLGQPRAAHWSLVVDPGSQELVRGAADVLRAEFSPRSIPLGFGECPVDALNPEPLFEQLPNDLEAACAEHVRVFGLGCCRECPPYETEFQPNEDTFFRSQQLADIAGFYRAFGIHPDSTVRERPDYLPLELEFQSFLLLKKRASSESELTATEAAERAALCQSARAAFFRDHLSWWVPSFALALRAKAGHGFYAAAAQLLAALMPVERYRLGVDAPRMPLQACVSPAPTECEGCGAIANS